LVAAGNGGCKLELDACEQVHVLLQDTCRVHEHTGDVSN
jgi:hypothetical protein